MTNERDEMSTEEAPPPSMTMAPAPTVQMAAIRLPPVATKVWSPDLELEPPGDDLFNRESCPEMPPNWLREDPEVAAELYVMERWHADQKVMRRERYEVVVLDSHGQLWKFEVTARKELVVHVKEAK